MSLRIFGDELDPEGVSALLGGVPTHSHRKDEVGDGDTSPAGTGTWVLEAALPDSAEIEEAVADLFGRLTSDLDEWATLSAEFAVDIRCELELVEGVGDGDGFDLSPRLAVALAERGVVLSFSLVGRS